MAPSENTSSCSPAAPRSVTASGATYTHVWSSTSASSRVAPDVPGPAVLPGTWRAPVCQLKT